MHVYLFISSQSGYKQIIKLHVSVAIVCLLWVWPVCLAVGLLDLNRLSEGLEITSSLHWTTRGGQDTTRMKNGRKKIPSYSSQRKQRNKSWNFKLFRNSKRQKQQQKISQEYSDEKTISV